MSDRPAQKFQVGEEVIVLPTAYDAGGEGVVTGAHWTKSWLNLEQVYYCGWAYVVYPFSPGGTGAAEQQLRKKPKPSTQSFTELLQSIQQPKKVKA